MPVDRPQSARGRASQHLQPGERSPFLKKGHQQASFHMEHNVRVAAKVSPANQHFADLYEITGTSVGRGMSGSVMLARRKRPTPPPLAMDQDAVFNTGGSSSSTSVPAATPRNKDDFGSRLQIQTSFLSIPAEPSPFPTPKTPGPSDLVAVKTLEKRGLSASRIEKLLQEVEIHLKMDHMNVARLLRVFDEPDRVYLVMEYYAGGSLADKLSEVGRFSEKDAKAAVKEILVAVNYCHRHPCGRIVHRDLKPANFMYASRAPGAALKLVDFGLSRVLSPDRPWLRDAAGTLWFVAPEVLLRRQYDQSCDLWSVGVMAYCLLCGRPPFDAPTDRRLAKAVSKGQFAGMVGSEWAEVGDQAKDFVQHLLRVRPQERPDAATALQHPWLAGSSASWLPGMAGAELLHRDVSHVSLSPELLQRVRHFARQSALRRAVAALVVYSESVPFGDAAEKVAAQFREIDVNGKGTVSANDLATALRVTLGVPEEESRWVFGRLDTDGDTELHYSEFLAAALGAQILNDGETVKKAFATLDKNLDGQVESAELAEVLGEEFCGRSCKDIFTELCGFDSTCPGVDLDRFSRTLLQRQGSLELPPEPHDTEECQLTPRRSRSRRGSSQIEPLNLEGSYGKFLWDLEDPDKVTHANSTPERPSSHAARSSSC